MAETAQSKLSEQEFLRKEAEKAKAAVAQSLEQAKEALAKNVDPRSITRRHPWLAMGTSAIAAFTAVALVVPSKEEQELRRLERLRRAMNPDPPAQPAAIPAAETNGSAPKPPEKRSLGSTLLHELIQLIRPMLMAAITASIKARANPPAPPSTPSPNPENP